MPKRFATPAAHAYKKGRSGITHKDINDYLRARKMGTGRNPAIESIITSLMNDMKTIGDAPTPFYRGCGKAEFTYTLPGRFRLGPSGLPPVNMQYVKRDFTSITTSFQTAKQFANGKGYLLHVTVDPELKMYDYHELIIQGAGEAELLLEYSTLFEVTKVTEHYNPAIRHKREYVIVEVRCRKFR